MQRRAIQMQLSREWQETDGFPGIRGLPLGYLIQLEQRLADTELALFEALATLHSLGHGELALAKASTKPGNESRQGKQARMEEWTRLPLRDGNSSDIKTWWKAKDENYIIHESSEHSWPQFSLMSTDNPSMERVATNNAAKRMKTFNFETRASPQSPAASQSSAFSTDTLLNYRGNLRYSNDDLRRLPATPPPPESIINRDVGQQHIFEGNTGYASIIDTNQPEALPRELQTSETGDGDKASILASTQSNLYF
ncbi:hypothetical protein UA08_05314 [Talaromyces atroroseus]|uniref:Uncharacterized protein n=1 Tax=Talaromyces atroroseus TaxID=1441469 RepID=A0A225AEE8_TALAT|nr:hypothetical protein UA08_05314 [Talaromyces atroroseus]OKL59642.1 hypothetical protein UA08_05314 [Talaromyces atroroseus]